ncbi:MAG TPA: efflux RND transporter periplasmic adaptor subunit [Anaeromyxobacteraceae bacterium]|nr:efflux RND transporter periplasmic adaptor subunit [Anaeromyxobacteraceae bacterium]
MKRLLLALSVLAACERKPPPESPQAPPGEAWLTDKQVAEGKIAVEPAAVRPVGAPVLAPARIAFSDLRVSHVLSPVSGRVIRVLAQPGERVRSGQTLAVIESPDVGQVFSDLRKAEADLQAAGMEHERQKELFAARAGARRDLETAESNYLKAKAERDRAREKAKLLPTTDGSGVSQNYELRSPIDGQVIFRSINPGTEVQGQYAVGQAIELFTIGELDPVWALADVFAVDLFRIAPGAEAQVTLPALPGRVFKGKVDWISGALDPAARTARVRITLPNPDGALRPEMLGSASIAGKTHEALAVPRSALLRLGDQTVVFVEAGRAPDGRVRFERRPVEVEDTEGDWSAVTSGLKAGDRVVSSGGILLVGLL